MRILFLSVFLCIICTTSTMAQNYVLHDVKPNETPQLIAKNYGIPLANLYKYNPNLSETSELSAPKIVIPKATTDNFKFIEYRVKQKETLYSLSKLYGLSIEDIKAFNPQLFKYGLKAGEVLSLPAYKLPAKYQKLDFNQSLKNSTFSAFKHIVLPQETKSDILQMYGMSRATFDSLNSNIIDVQSGQLVKVISKKNRDNKISFIDLNMELDFYKVPSKQTMYSLSREFGVSEEIIYKLNPIVKREGLKSGMIIKIPKKLEKLSSKNAIVNLENYIQNLNEKKLALLLPFSLQVFEGDSVKKKNLIYKNTLLNISLDIYEGVNWAKDYAKSKGIYTDLEVYDTRGDSNYLNNLLDRSSLEDRDAIIGPLLTPNIKVITQKLNYNPKPVFLPFTNYEESKSFIFNSLPQEDLKAETLITYIDSLKTKAHNLIFISDNTSTNTINKYKYTFPLATFYDITKSYAETEDILKLLKPNTENWVVLETNQKGVAESVVNILHREVNRYTNNKRKENNYIKLFTSNQNQSFNDVVSNKALCDLFFTVISTSKYNVLESNALIEEYKKKHGVIPNRFVLRAFDLTYDIILRLAYNGSLNDERTLRPYTEYNENRFGYERPFMSNIFYNKGLYIIKYLPNFEYEVINAKTP